LAHEAPLVEAQCWLALFRGGAQRRDEDEDSEETLFALVGGLLMREKREAGIALIEVLTRKV